MKKYINKSWRDITISMFYEIYDLLSKTDDSLEVALYVLKLFYNKDFEILPLDEYYAALETVKFVNTDIPKGTLGKTVKLGEHRYKVLHDITEMPTDTYISLIKEFNDTSGKNIHKIVSCFLQGDYDDCTKEEDVLLFMNVVDALGVVRIFEKAFKKSLKNSFKVYFISIMNTDISLKNKYKLIKSMLKFNTNAISNNR